MTLLHHPQHLYARSVTNRNYLIGHVPIAELTRDGKSCLLKKYPDVLAKYVEVELL
jgi:hypothetical protein